MNWRAHLIGCGLLLATLAGVAIVQCDRGESAQKDDAVVVDSELLAFLSLARAHHHEANLLEQDGDLADAIAALKKIIDAPMPHAGQKFPEIEEVLADTYARMAELELQNKDTDGALRDVTAGLSHVSEPTYFRGHLLEVYGIIEEARTAAFADAGKTADAERARAHALVLLREAVDVQESVIGHVLDGGTRDGGAK